MNIGKYAETTENGKGGYGVCTEKMRKLPDMKKRYALRGKKLKKVTSKRNIGIVTRSKT